MPSIQTVTGPIDLDDLGPTLVHEHVVIMNTEYNQNYQPDWDEEARISDAVEKLNELSQLGITSIMDPTVLGLGRYIPRIKRIAEQANSTSSWPPACTRSTTFPCSSSIGAPGASSTSPSRRRLIR